MHPAYSVIFFTTAAGAGYGLLALLGLGAALHAWPLDRWFSATAFAIALGAVTFGLLSSMLHLGRPERAWRAFSQWRSSWLAREGVLAVLSYGPALVLAWACVADGMPEAVLAASGLASAVMAVLTVHATGMIYATLKPIHAWCNRWVVPNYLALALHTGAMWLNAIATGFGLQTPMLALAVVVVLFLAFYLKRAYWRFIDSTAAASTPGTATGLGRFGDIRLLDPPNTQANYLQKEMGYAIARKHAAKLRRWTFLLLFAIPLLLVVVGMGEAAWLAIPSSALAALSATIGVLIERWLFFAEARHTVMLYYGNDRA